jgi:hypothetical protein
MKQVLMGLCLIFLMVFSGTWAIADSAEQTEMCIPMGNIELSPPGSVNGKRSDVKFPHSEHFTYSCKKCHHKWKGNEDIKGCMTSDCHNVAQSPQKTRSKIPAIQYYKTAYHKACIGCHKEVKTENKAKAASGVVLKEKLYGSGPTSCKGCHYPID